MLVVIVTCNVVLTDGMVFVPTTSITTFMFIKCAWAVEYGSFVVPFGVNAYCRWNSLPFLPFFVHFFIALVSLWVVVCNNGNNSKAKQKNTIEIASLN